MSYPKSEVNPRGVMEGRPMKKAKIPSRHALAVRQLLRKPVHP
jgi:hypothetical protein